MNGTELKNLSGNTTTPNFKLLDVVEVTTSMPELKLKKGRQGTIVEVYSYPREAFEVEFGITSGKTEVLEPRFLALSEPRCNGALEKIKKQTQIRKKIKLTPDV